MTVLNAIGVFLSDGSFRPDTDVKAIVRDALIDTLGCLLVGARQAVTQKALAAVALRAGNAPVFGTGHTRSPDAAALVNGTSAHAIEFDDWEVPGNTHPGAVLFPALFAATEGRAISGRAMLNAYIAGYEVIARIGEGINYDHYSRGWHATGTLGATGAAAAVAHLWQLDAEACKNAVSIAISRASGLTAQFGSDAKPLQCGFAAEAGYIAATLARAGLTGQSDLFEGPKGFHVLTSHGDTDRMTQPFRKIGQPLALGEYGLGVKAYPSCGYTHRIIDCALALHDRNTLDPDDITAMEMHLPDMHADILPFGQPGDESEARFSLPFCAALALCHGAVTLQAFEDRLWRDTKIQRLIHVSSVHPFRPSNPLLNYDPDEPDRLIVTTRDGSRHEETVAYPPGSPQRPMSHHQIMEKFMLNAGLSASAPDAIKKLERLSAWPDSDNISDILHDWA